nr:deoxyribodipyrimidine photo-lyase [Dyella sp. ASV24]
MSTAIVWFRRDLRLADHPALSAACQAFERIIPVYIHAPHEDDPWPAGAASRWWLHHSLTRLDAQLQGHGNALYLAQGDSLQVLRDLITRTGATAVYWNRCYEPASIARDSTVKAALREQGIEAHSFNGSLWHEPWQIETKQGEPYRVFTPFWKNLRQQLDASQPSPIASSLRGADIDRGLPLDALKLLPGIPWDAGLKEAWQPGEEGAHELVDIFLDDAVNDYAKARDLPARHGTSRLSPHLHFGEISPRQIHYRLTERAAATDARRRPDIEPYLRELGWREFAHHLLYHFPATPTENFNDRFNRFSWMEDAVALERWQQGRTGIPLVDAGMRELWHTGWMHNRVRMIVASFLTKNLRQHWRHGARWFWDTLVDADLANNTLGWQWVAGSGADAAPYFRVFNPVTQAQKFDPEGQYLRRWLPELSSAPLPLLHEPWRDAGLLKRSGYPAPMVDLGETRQSALDAYQHMRSV